MKRHAGIAWTEETWNPTTGCDRISAGCDNCYALDLAASLKRRGSAKYQNDGGDRSGPGFAFTMHDSAVDIPRRWAKPRVVFVNSMSDLFHEEIEVDFLKRVFATMNETPQHTYQVLTKRSRRLVQLASEVEWTPNIWMGVSVENQKYAFRARHLAEVPAAVRFLSVEPLVGPADSLILDGIHWVIVGGESGNNARPMHPDWLRSIRDQVLGSEMYLPERPALFVKQWGAWKPADRPGDGFLVNVDGSCPEDPDDVTEGAVWMNRSRGKAELPEIDGQVWDEMPETGVGVLA